MPSSCCDVGCSNRNDRNSKLKFYQIPIDSERRKLWKSSIKRTDWDDVKINNARVCSAHFVSGRKVDNPSNVDFVPSIFQHNEEKRKRKSAPTVVERNARASKRQKLQQQQHNDHDVEATFDQNLDSLSPEESDADLNHKLRAENEDLRQKLAKATQDLEKCQTDNVARVTEVDNLKKIVKKNTFRYKSIKGLADMHKFYTGVSPNVFKWVLENSNLDVVCPRITKADHLFLVLIKLRLGLTNKDLAYRFGLSFSVVSRIYRVSLKKLSKLMHYLIIWPEKSALRKNLPKCFRKKYLRCVCIIDCTEIFIERPLNLNARAQTWSNYKNTNTIKYLVACTPSGAVSFLSEGWGGRVSDKEITVKSGFLDIIEPKDQILADRGFTVDQEIATRGGILEIPSFTKGKSQLSANEVDRSRQIANVRIHIERVIGRMRKWNILNTVVPITQADLLDDVMIIISGLVNLCGGIV